MDSEPLWGQVDYEMFEERGLQTSEDLFRRRLGTGNKRTIEIYKEEFSFNESVEELMEERERRFFKLLDKRIPPMHGVIELVEFLNKRKIKIAIATSGPHKDRMKRILKELGISKYVSAIVTGDEIEKLKPAPDIFLLAAKKLNIKSEFCVVFEDAPSGVEAGKAAGMLSYGVNRDNKTREQLIEKGADKVFKNLLEIL